MIRDDMRKALSAVIAILMFLAGCTTVHLHQRKVERIMGTDSITAAQMERFLLRNNPMVPHRYARKLIATYEQECRYEGVRPSVAFAQMCLETGFLSFPPTTAIVLEQNNFCGFGTTSSMSVGESFKDMRTGVRVQVQHLKAYATTEATRRRNIDPRRHLVRLGSAPTVMKLSGKWATDPGYGEKLCVFLDRLRNE